ncbi:hypothetical protein A3A38_02135 [Candidatus Kaiserbacteria bacterium RIFCSPLOWO2_01_FULL_53_17]|uniref:Fido domain-containing protein n=1 Tax=Candidatus Kaiserbacteria bacterium RIFCSPLOWO2_01_FULL_53_17 TaxID=1798511 RepID=A0A1F6EFP7_9BACT|nr:MAG: hypothetical protein A3A38_02135 [Candidatus Kaiserbacteria bacterium RIFCSPLOWO2_01_FULL_53_17]
MDRAHFRRIFLENCARRSRTLQSGSTKAGSGVRGKKKPVDKEPVEIARIAAENTEQAALFVWRVAGLVRQPLSARRVRAISERIYTILQHELALTVSYDEEQRELGRQGREWSSKTRLAYAAHPHYRVWEVDYAAHNPHPLEIGVWMESFYAMLPQRITEYHSRVISLPFLLAWADRELDFVIHPWQDGCGRHATAMVLWLARVLGSETLPLFGWKEEHYRAIKTIEGHTGYFARCLEMPLA